MVELASILSITVIFLTLLAFMKHWSTRLILYIGTVAMLFVLVHDSLGRSKPLSWEWSRWERAEIRASVANHGQSLDVLVDTPQGRRFYTMPWNNEEAKRLEGARKGEGKVMLERGGSTGTNGLVVTAPPPALPPKGN